MRDERLKLVSYCPLCGARPVHVDARVLGGETDTQLMHVTCRRCAAHMLALTLVTPGSVGAVGLVTDLNADDAVRFARAPAISADDALRVHAVLDALRPAAWIPQPLSASRPAARRPAPKKNRASAKGGKPRRAS